jgi:hypothetical protein
MIDIHPDIRDYFEKKYDGKIVRDGDFNKDLIICWMISTSISRKVIAMYYPFEGLKILIYSFDSFLSHYKEKEMLQILKMKAFI